MALVALFAKTALVLIVILMAGITFGRYRQITLLRMAITALNTLVFTVQGEFSLVMVVLKIIPGTFTMTTVAYLSQLPFMRFIFLVAIDALMLCLVVFLADLVTGLTGHRQVTTPQGEICRVMIESLLIK